MLAIERRAKIEELITKNGSVLVTELAKQFEVTPETIRGDLLKLEKQGILMRTYGGAILAGSAVQELSIAERDALNSDAKQKIGKRAAELIDDGDTIFLDASTSALHLARNIKNKQNLTVITNSHNIVSELADCENIRVICTGGALSPKNMSYTGIFTEDMIRSNLAAKKIFFSCRGVSLDRGLMDSSEDEAEIKLAMIQHSYKVIFLCDRNKINRISIPVIAGLDKLNVFITDAQLDRGMTDKLNELNVEIITV